MDDNTNIPSSTGGDNTNQPAEKKPVSAAKLEANRRNAQKSSGPKTAAGKARSSQNAYRHGFFSDRLFPTAEQVSKDRTEYEALAKGLYGYYEPVGYLENLLVEKIAAGFLRFARLLTHEQRVFEKTYHFQYSITGNLNRSQTTIDRELARDTQQLERLQAIRKAHTDRMATAEGAELPLAAAPEQVDFELPVVSPTAEVPDESKAPNSENAGTNPTAVVGDGSKAGREAGQATGPCSGHTAETKPPTTLADIVGKEVKSGFIETIEQAAGLSAADEPSEEDLLDCL